MKIEKESLKKRGINKAIKGSREVDKLEEGRKNE